MPQKAQHKASAIIKLYSKIVLLSNEIIRKKKKWGRLFAVMAREHNAGSSSNFNKINCFLLHIKPSISIISKLFTCASNQNVRIFRRFIVVCSYTSHNIRLLYAITFPPPLALLLCVCLFMKASDDARIIQHFHLHHIYEYEKSKRAEKALCKSAKYFTF